MNYFCNNYQKQQDFVSATSHFFFVSRSKRTGPFPGRAFLPTDQETASRALIRPACIVLDRIIAAEYNRIVNFICSRVPAGDHGRSTGTGQVRQTFKLPASHKNIEAIKKYYGKLDFIFPDALRSALNPADKYTDR